MTSEAKFVGGPADGTLLAFPDDEPPRFFDLVCGPALASADVTVARYVRQVSPDDDGPLWQMVFESAEVR